MLEKIRVHERVMTRHPELRRRDVKSAWRNAMVVVERHSGEMPGMVLVAIGSDPRNRLLEMVATPVHDGGVLIFHAMTPPSTKTLQEVGLKR